MAPRRRSEKPAADPPSGGRSDSILWAVMAGTLVILAALLFSQTRQFGLLGWDTYPVIAASRIGSWSDLMGSFTERLMDGRYQGQFYRPVLNLAVALDYALWGLEPFGYQLGSLFWFAACAGALGALASRLTGGETRVAPWVAMTLFIIHPMPFEVLPVPARRAEILCCLFMVCSLLIQLSPKALGRRRLNWWPVVPSLLAMGSKETGFMLPLLGLAAVTLYSPRQGFRARLAHGVAGAVPHLAAMGVMFAVRAAVLGGWGGYEDRAFATILTDFPAYMRRVAGALLLPQGVARGAFWVFTVFAVAFLLGGITLLRGTRRGSGGSARGPGSPWLARACGFGLIWMLWVGLVYSATGAFSAWYLLVPLAGWAVLLGAIADALVTALRGTRGLRRVVALPTLVAFLVVLGWQVRYSPLVYHYEEWSKATRAGDSFLSVLEQEIGQARQGSRVWAPPMPVRVSATPGEPAVRSAAILSDYSVQAWADLKFPDRRIRIRGGGVADPPPAADEVVVVLERRREGF